MDLHVVGRREPGVRQTSRAEIQAAIEAEHETEVVVDEDLRQDLVVIFERIEAAGYMTKRMRPVHKCEIQP